MEKINNKANKKITSDDEFANKRRVFIYGKIQEYVRDRILIGRKGNRLIVITKNKCIERPYKINFYKLDI